MNHSADCNQAQERVLADQKIWPDQWPEYCKACDGAGIVVFYESHGFNYGAREELQDPCHGCTEKGICARCGRAGLTEDGEGPCSFCQWNYDDLLVPAFECYGDCIPGQIEEAYG